MMNIILLYANIAVPSLAPLLSARIVKLTLKYGLCDISSIGFVTYAMLVRGNGADLSIDFVTSRVLVLSHLICFYMGMVLT